jgi:uncharacterized protein YllA (UPF0747 family)
VRIVSEPLGGSALSQLLQRGEAPATWLPRAPASSGEWRDHARARRAEGWSERLEQLAPALAASGAAADRLARVRDEGGVVVTTGQQPGLFGGPLYTWAKAVSAIALADAIEQHTGVPAVPVFWAATDDADFAEASETAVARGAGVDVLRATLAPAPGTPMSLAPLGNLDDALRRLREASGSAADPRPLAAVESAYRDPGHTVGEAFVQLLRALLEPFGMPVLDASHSAVRDASAPTLSAALRAAGRIESALAARAAEIRASGYTPQVEEVAGRSLVFARVGSSKRRLSTAEASSASEGWCTPNVLLRPIVERAILPTVAYVAGPGELAYFAQVSAVARALDVAPPLAVPRWSSTLVEAHVQELLDRFGVGVSDVATPDGLEGQVARARMAPATVATLARLRAAIAGLPADLAGQSELLGLDAAVLGGAHALRHRVDRLERRLLAGIKRHETALMRDVATLRAALYPRGLRQERVLNGIPLFARHGLALLSNMRDAAAGHAASLVEPTRDERSVGARS